MKIFAGLSIIFCYSMSFLYADTNRSKSEPTDIKQKALFKGKAYYDKRIQKKYEASQREKNRTTLQEKKPLPRRQDGSVDTYRFLNENRR